MKIKDEISKDFDANRQLKEFNNLRRDFHIIQQHKSPINKKFVVGRSSRRWSHRRRLGTIFSPWTTWSHCNVLCKQKRERFCIVKRKCGDMKHIEERHCSLHL